MCPDQILTWRSGCVCTHGVLVLQYATEMHMFLHICSILHLRCSTVKSIFYDADCPEAKKLLGTGTGRMILKLGDSTKATCELLNQSVILHVQSNCQYE